MEIAAYHMTTQKQWADIILSGSTLSQLEDLRNRVHQHRHEIIGRPGSQHPGIRTVFYGPPGTGKSFTAALLGKELDIPVYRIDLTGVGSRYIGETEKNLDTLFARAEEQGWILFFDEADALFGKRTEVKDSHDRYANEAISYLLQKMENYNGLVILASNRQPDGVNEPGHRFQPVIHFPLPGVEERKKLWRLGLQGSRLVEQRVDLDGIARQYELSPASIIHITHKIGDNALTGATAATAYEKLIREIEYEQARIPGRQASHQPG
jgi:SpoVK/Ycf46/Vps4 family AAA+-type ATPase